MNSQPTCYLQGVISISLFLLFILPSCKKEDKQSDISNLPLQKSSKEYIIFDSKEKMQRCIEDLMANNLEEPSKILNSYQAPRSFSSYYNVNHQGRKSYTERESIKDVETAWSEDLVQDPYLT